MKAHAIVNQARDRGRKFVGRPGEKGADGPVGEGGCAVVVVGVEFILGNAGDEVVGVVVGDRHHGKNFAGIRVLHHGGAAADLSHNVFDVILQVGINGELDLGSFAGRLVVVGRNDFLFLISNEDPFTTGAFEEGVHGCFDSADSFVVAFVEVVSEFIRDVSFSPLLDVSEDVTGEGAIWVDATGGDPDFHAPEFAAANRDLGELLVGEISFVFVGDKASVGEVMTAEGLGKALTFQSKFREAGNDPFVDDANDVFFGVELGHAAGSGGDFRLGEARIVLILLLVALINVIEIEDYFVASPVSGESESITIYDFPPHSGLPDGDGMSGGNVGDKL